MTNCDALAETVHQYPETFAEFKRIQTEQYVTFCKKMHDYGASNIAMGLDLSKPENINVSLSGIVIRVNDKIQRLFNLIFKNKSAVNEPIEDAFKDTAVYCIIAQIVSNKKWGK